MLSTPFNYRQVNKLHSIDDVQNLNETLSKLLVMVNGSIRHVTGIVFEPISLKSKPLVTLFTSSCFAPKFPFYVHGNNINVA